MRPTFENITSSTTEQSSGRPAFNSITQTIYNHDLLDKDERVQSFLSQDLDEDAKSKLVNSLYISDTYKVPFEQAYQNHDGVVNQLFKTTNAKSVMNKILNRNQTNEQRFDDYDNGYYDKARETHGRVASGFISFWEKAKDRYNRMGVDMVKQASGLVEAVGDVTFSETLTNWSGEMRMGVQEYMKQNPDEFLNPGGKGFWDTTWSYIKDPEYILLGVMEQVPNMALAYLGNIAGAGVAAGATVKGVATAKWIGGMQGFAVPSFGRRYSDLRGDGISPMMALPEAFLGSQAEALLEEWTFSRKLAIFKNAGKAVERGIGTTAARVLLGGAKAYGRGAVEEGSQQVSDNFLAIMFRDANIGLLNDVGNSAAAGGILEMTMAGAFHTAGTYKRQVNKEVQLQRLETLREKLNEIPLNQTHKEEINKEIDALKEHVEKQNVLLGEATLPESAIEDPEVKGQKAVPQEVETSQRYGIEETKDGWSVKDWESEETVSTHTTDREAVAEMKKLNQNEFIAETDIPLGDSGSDIITPDMYIGNVTQRMKKEFGEIWGKDPSEVKPFLEGAFPTKRTPISITKAEAVVAHNELKSFILDALENNKIKTENDLALAQAFWGNIVSLRKALGLPSAASPIKVIRSKKHGMIVIANTKSRIYAAIRGVDTTVTVRQALQAVMQKMSQAAQKAYMQSARDMIGFHRNLNKYAREKFQGLNINKAQMSKLMTAIANVKGESGMIAAHAVILRITDVARHENAVRQVKKTVTRINRLIGKTRIEGGIAPDYLERIKAVTDTFTVKKQLSEKQKKRAVGLSKYLESIKKGESQTYSESYAEERIPKELLAAVEQLGIKNIEDMTVTELNDTNNILKMLLHLNKTKNTIINKRTGEKVAEGLNSAIEEVGSLKNKSELISKGEVTLTDRPDKATGVAGWLKGISKPIIDFVVGKYNHDPETLAETISGGIHGSIFDIIANGMSDGRSNQAKFQNEWDDIVQKYLKDIPLSDLQELSSVFYQWIKNPTLRATLAESVGLKQTSTYSTFKDRDGKTIKMTMAEMMAVYMMTENMDTVSEMIKAGVASSKMRLGPITFDNIVSIRGMVEKNATAMKLIEMAKGVKQYEAGKINEISRLLDGIDIASIEAYWHRERFTGGGVAGHQAFRNSLLESMGWLKEREGSGNPVIIRDFFEAIISDQQAISEYVGMAQPYRNIKNLLNFREFRDALQSKGYGSELKLIDSLIERTEQRPREFSILDNAVSKIVHGLTRSVLANPGIMAGQIASLVPIFENEISSKYMSNISLSMNKDYVNRLKANWYIYRQRLEGMVSSIALKEIGESDIALRKFTGKSDYINYLLKGIHYVDSVAVTSIGRIVEAEMADGNLSGISAEYWTNEGINPSDLVKDSPEYWDAFRKRADYVLRRTQPMFFGESKSILTSDTSPARRSLFLFRSYIDQPMRQAYRAINDYGNGRITAVTAAKRMSALWAGLAAYEIIRAAIRKGLFKSDEDEKDLILSILAAPVKMLPVIGYAGQKIITEVADFKMTGDPIDLRYLELSPLPLQFANDIITHTGNIARGIGYSGTKTRFESGQYKGELKSDVYLRKGIYGIASGTLKYYGVPIMQVESLFAEKKAKKKGFL